jgi:glycosyl transferase family 2
MPDQAMKTLCSLSSRYQKNVSEGDYEVIVVENASDNNLVEQNVTSLGDNFKYYRREDNSGSPAAAINFGAEKATYTILSIMIDGARMLSPGVIYYTLAAYRINEFSVVAVPGYHLGHGLQQKTSKSGYNEKTEKKLLSKINWPQDGYRLFEIAVFSATSAPGFFSPIAECNCISLPKSAFYSAGGCDERFDSHGGGYVNLDLYKRFCEIPKIELFFLIGEGSFHQFHGGATTGPNNRLKREILQKQFRRQYEKIRGEKFKPPQTKPIYLGKLPDGIGKFLKTSVKRLKS